MRSLFFLSTLFILLALAAWGFFSIPYLNIRLTASSTKPAIAVKVANPGMAAAELEADVVRLLESGFARCPNVGTIYSVTEDYAAFVYISPDNDHNIDRLYSQIVMKMRSLYPYLPEGTPWPEIELSNPTTGFFSERLFSCIGFDMLADGKSMQELALKPEWSGLLEFRVYPVSSQPEWLLSYGQKDLKVFDITPGEIMQQVRQFFHREAIGNVSEEGVVVPLQKGAALASEVEFGAVPILGARQGTLLLKDLGKLTIERGSSYPKVRIDGKNVVVADVFSEGAGNHWWQAWRYSRLINEKVPRSSNWIFTQNISKEFNSILWPPFVFSLGLLLVLILLASVVGSWRSGLVLFLGFFKALGLSLLLFVACDLNLTPELVKQFLIFQGLSLIWGWFVVIDASNDYQSSRRVGLIYVSMVLAFGVSGLIRFDPPTFVFSIPHILFLGNLSAAFLVWFVCLPLFKKSILNLSQSNSMAATKAERPPLFSRVRFPRKLISLLWLLSIGVPIDFWGSGKDRQPVQDDLLLDVLRGSSGIFFDMIRKEESSAGDLSDPILQISIQCNPMLHESSFQSWLDEFERVLIKKIDKRGMLHLSKTSPLSAHIEVYFDKAIKSEALYPLFFWLENHTNTDDVLRVYASFYGQKLQTKHLQKTFNYRIQVAGFDYYTTKKWTNTLTKDLGKHPRVLAVDKIFPAGNQWKLPEHAYTILPNSNYTDQDLFRRSAFWRGEEVYDPELKLRIKPVYLLPYYGERALIKKDIPGENSSKLKTASGDRERFIVRKDQQYIQELEFEFMGPYQVGVEFLKGKLKALQLQMPSGYVAGIPLAVLMEEPQNRVSKIVGVFLALVFAFFLAGSLGYLPGLLGLTLGGLPVFFLTSAFSSPVPSDIEATNWVFLLLVYLQVLSFVYPHPIVTSSQYAFRQKKALFLFLLSMSVFGLGGYYSTPLWGGGYFLGWFLWVGASGLSLLFLLFLWIPFFLQKAEKPAP